jgi:hypothetical protein
VPIPGAGEITTHLLDAPHGTKLRALYRRKKRRDLFNLAVAPGEGEADPARVIAALRLPGHGGHYGTRLFEQNLASKLADR